MCYLYTGFLWIPIGACFSVSSLQIMARITVSPHSNSCAHAIPVDPIPIVAQLVPPLTSPVPLQPALSHHPTYPGAFAGSLRRQYPTGEPISKF